MRTYAEHLNTMTVKSLNALAKSLKLRGYSKLRKAPLIVAIDNAIALDHDSAFVLVNDFNEQSVKIEKNVVCMYCGARFATVEDSIEHINECADLSAEREAEIAAIEVESTDNVEFTPEVNAQIDRCVVAFSAAYNTAKAAYLAKTPAKAPEIAAKPRTVATATKVTNPYAGEDTDELIDTYRYMRATQHNARGITHAKLEARLAKIEKVLRSRKVNMREV